MKQDGITPWEAIDTDRIYESQKQEHKQSITIKKVRPKTAIPIKTMPILPKKQRKTNLIAQKVAFRKQSAKIQLEQQFIRLKSEQFPLRTHVRQQTYCTLTQSQFKISEKQQIRKMHQPSSHKRLYSSYKNNFDKANRKIIKHQPQFFQFQKKNYQIHSNKIKLTLPNHRNAQEQKQLLLSNKLSKLIKRTNRKQNSNQATITYTNNNRRNGFIYFNQQIQ